MNDLSKLIVGGQVPAQVPRKTARRRTHEAEDVTEHYPEHRARVNIIPTPDKMAQLINRALNALSRGVYWDRGSIVNILL